MIALADLKAWLSVEGNADDALLAALELRAVAFLEQQTGRYFGEPKEFVEVLDGGRVALRLQEPPREDPAPEVAEWTGTAWVALPSSEWEISAYYVYRTSRAAWASGSRRFRVTYQAGYTAGEEPETIRQAVLDLVAEKYRARAREGVRSETLGSYSYTRADLEAVTGLMDTLDAWRHVALP